jgi:hypothetical protein
LTDQERLKAGDAISPERAFEFLNDWRARSTPLICCTINRAAQEPAGDFRCTVATVSRDLTVTLKGSDGLAEFQLSLMGYSFRHSRTDRDEPYLSAKDAAGTVFLLMPINWER